MLPFPAGVQRSDLPFVLVNPRTVDQTAEIQAHLDAGRNVQLNNGTFDISILRFKLNGQFLRGAGRYRTTLSCDSASPTGASVISNDDPLTTREGCKLTDLTVYAPNLEAGYVVNWKSMQHGYISDVHAYAALVNSVGFLLAAEWGTSECTFNTFDRVYASSCLNGVTILDGANNNLILNSRFHTGEDDGYGILQYPSDPARSSCNTIIGGGTEFSGNICNGIYVRGASTTVIGHRFEELNIGLTIDAGATDTVYQSLYFSGVATPISGTGTRTIGIDRGKLSLPGLATSSAGLATGTIWNDSGTLKVV